MNPRRLVALAALSVAAVGAARGAEPAVPLVGYLPVFERVDAWVAGSNYGYDKQPGVNLKSEAGVASPAGNPSVKVTFTGAGWGEKPYERDIYLTLPVRIERRPKTIMWWIWADAKKEWVSLHLRDARGETLVWSIVADWSGWKKIEFDGAKPHDSWGGDEGNRKKILDTPIARVAIDIMESRGATPGPRELAFADLCMTEDVAAAGEDPRPAATMAPTTVPPSIDGKLDDPCYAAAARVTELYTSSGSPFKVPHATEVFVTYDAANLYVAFRCHDEPGHKLAAEERPRDGAVWEDDSVELMVVLPGEAGVFHHIIVNALGDVYDEKWAKDPQGGGRWDGKWNAEGLKATAAGDEAAGGYTVEMGLPLAAIGAATPVTGQPWRMNFSRMRRIGGKDDPAEASSWGGSQHFQSLDTPGWVWPDTAAVRVEVPATPWEVGVNDLRLRIADAGRPARKVRVDVTVYDRMSQARPTSRTVQLPEGGAEEVRFPVELTTADDGGHVRIEIADAARDTVIYRNLVRPVPIKHLLEFETDAVAYGAEDDLCRVLVGMNLPPEALIPCRLNVTWTRRATGKLVYRQLFDYFYDSPMRVAVSLGLFPPGVYDIEATLTGAADKVLERRRFAVTRLPRREHALDPAQRVDLGPGREFRVNSKPFFPLGVYHTRPEDYPVLKRYGFNYVEIWVGPPKDAPLALDQSWAAGLYAELGLCDLGYNWEGFYRDPEGARQRMRQRVELTRQHPGLLLYQLGDELANDKIDDFVPLYQAVKQLDPDHLQSMTTGTCWLSAEQIRKRASVSDIVSPDLYNVGQGPLTEHPRICDLYREALAPLPGKALTKVPQATGYSRVGYRLPTPEEMRYMVHADIVHGVKGLCFYKWGAHHNDPSAETGLRHDYRLMSAVRQLNWEVADLADAICAGRPFEVRRGSDCSKVVEVWCRETQDRHFLWAVNHATTPQRLAVVPPALKPADRVEVFYEDREVQTADDGTLTEELPAFAVHVYVWPGIGTFTSPGDGAAKPGR